MEGRLELTLNKLIKSLLVCGAVLGVVVWFASAGSSQAVGSLDTNPKLSSPAPQVLSMSAATLAKTATKHKPARSGDARFCRRDTNLGPESDCKGPCPIVICIRLER